MGYHYRMDLSVREEKVVALGWVSQPLKYNQTQALCQAPWQLLAQAWPCTLSTPHDNPGRVHVENGERHYGFYKRESQEEKIIGSVQVTEAGLGPAVKTSEETLSPSASVAPASANQLCVFLVCGDKCQEKSHNDPLKPMHWVFYFSRSRWSVCYLPSTKKIPRRKIRGIQKQKNSK